MKRIHYAWWVCIGCAILLFCTSGLSVNAFTVYQPYILQQNGFTNAQSSTLITVRSLAAFVSMLLVGAYYRRLSLRAGMTVSGFIMALGFFAYGIAKTYTAYCAAAVLVGGGYGLGTMIPITIVLEHWFSKGLTLVIGICSSVTGLSTLGIPSLLTALIEHTGLRATFLAESAAIAALTVVSGLLIRSAPADCGMTPYGAEADGDGAQQIRRSVGVTRRDWFLFVPMVLLLAAAANVSYSHLTVHVTALGFSAQIAALSITISGLALMLGKIACGWVAAQLGAYRCNWIFGLTLLLGVLLLCFPLRSPALLYAAMAVYGAGLSFPTVGLASWVGDWSTKEQYDTVIARFQMLYSGGQLLFSSLPGILADHAGGSYRPAYLFFLLCAAFVLAAVQYVYRRKA